MTEKIAKSIRCPVDKIVSPLKAIRKHCIECMGGSYELIDACTAPACWLFPYRFGLDVRKRNKAKSNAQIAAENRGRMHLRKLNSSRRGVETEFIGRTRGGNSAQTSNDI